MSNELKSCPFCGGEGDIESQPSYSQAANTHERHRGWCDECGFGLEWHSYKLDAVAAWNTRVGSSDEHLRERIAVLERENRNYAKTMEVIGQIPAPPTLTAPPARTYADEDAALDATVLAVGWTDKRMIADARKIAAGVWFKTYGFGGECCLTGPQVASFRSCLDGARAAIRLLSQGEKA